MSWFTKTFSSTIGQKILVALTGLFLCIFLVIHLIGNFQLLKTDAGYAFNAYTKFMTSNPLIKIASYLTYLAILFHAFKGIHLAIKNRAARPVAYKSAAKSRVSGFSRSMALLGTIILIFIIIHMQQFWYEYKFGEMPKQEYMHMMLGDEEEVFTKNQFDSLIQTEYFTEYVDLETGKPKVTIQQEQSTYKDLYSVVNTIFKEPLYVLFYVLSMLAIAFHLFHGFKSAFQTMGWNHNKSNDFIKGFGYAFAIIIPALFALIPLYIYFN